ncbi:MAG TPA: cyclase family protein [Burkholderiales bacterium]|nr:cyclase family protein [Burkholderiales bacterium]
MAEQAWGKWGAEDERGALNHIAAEQVRHAAGLVRTGRVMSLAQPLSERTPVPGHRAPMLHFMGRDGGDYAAGGKRPGGFQFAEDTVVLPLHFGTHIDALCHAWYDDKLYNGFPSTGTRSTTGAARCGIDKMGPIVGRGVLLDLVAAVGRPLARGEPATTEILEQAAGRARVRIEKGDVVLIRTGWIETRLASPDYYDGEPGIDVGAARWLAERGVAAVGADNFAVEPIPFPPEQVFPVHQCLIRDFGIALIEGLVLAPLAEAEAASFLFMATPLPIRGGTGSPLVPLAVL